MNKRTAFDWSEFIIGILMIVMGVVTFVRPTLTVTTMVVLYGLIAIIMGICDIVIYVRGERYVGFGSMLTLIFGVISLLSGVMLISHPSTGRLLLLIIFPIWFISHCVSRISRLGIERFLMPKAMYWISLCINIAGIILGVLMIFSPAFSITGISVVVGIYLLLGGIDSIISVFNERS